MFTQQKFHKLMEADAGAGTGGEGTVDNAVTEEVETAETNTTETDGKTFSQADVDKMIQDRLTRAEKKWKKDLEAKQSEAQKLSKMNEEEQRKYSLNQKMQELESREAEITKRELKSEAIATLSKKGLPVSLAETLNLTNADTCQASITAVEKAFKEAVKADVNNKLRSDTGSRKITQPTGGNNLFGNMHFQAVRKTK